MVHALIFAGGTGTRMKSADIPKQFIEVDGKEIIIRTLEFFSTHPAVDAITVVCLREWIAHLEAGLKCYHIQKVSSIIPGGKSGYASIRLGLEEIEKTAAKEDIVLICDGVRPMLSEALINACIQETRQYRTAVPVTPSIDSVLVSEDGQLCRRHLERKQVYITQAPQGYFLEDILGAHREAEEKGLAEAISSADLFLELGREVHIFPRERSNIKATTPEDLYSLRASYYYAHHMRLAREEERFS